MTSAVKSSAVPAVLSSRRMSSTREQSGLTTATGLIGPVWVHRAPRCWPTKGSTPRLTEATFPAPVRA